MRFMDVQIEGQIWRCDVTRPHHLAIPLHFQGQQPNAFGLPEATAAPFAAGSFIGDVQQGGSVNCSTVTLNPHGSGTHTECIGHITYERFYVHECLQEAWLPCSVVSVELQSREESMDSYIVAGQPEELWITRSALERACDALEDAWIGALVVRTLPNESEKKHRLHSGHHPAYFSKEAMEYIRQRGVRHLLVDLPSVDRELDEGHLQAHHLFWSLDSACSSAPEAAKMRTITEMIYVENRILDGRFILNLQIAPFLLDAAPSRPLLFPVQPV